MLARVTVAQRALAMVLALLTCLFPVSGAAQAINGALTGTIIDPSGASVSGATVAVTNVNTGQKATTTTTSNGGYRFSELPVGHYRLSVSAEHFNTITQVVPVDLNRVNTVNVQLKVGEVSTTVEVTGAAAPVDTTTAQLQTNYGSRESADLSLSAAGSTGSGVINLSLLSPGVTQSSSMGLGAGPSVGGQRPRNNNFTIEGVDNNSKAITGYVTTVPSDAVESFTMLANQFSPEFGHSSGGQFNTVVKSGTNSYHGSVYEYFKNRNLNAEDAVYKVAGFATNPRKDDNRYGGTLGGPIIKDKLFFFADFEREPFGFVALASGGAVSTPTAAGLAIISADPLVNPTNLAVFKKYVPVGQGSTGTIPWAGAPGGTIPVGLATISNAAFSNYENFVGSMDWNVSQKDQFRLRYIYNKLDTLDTGAQLSAFFTTEPVRQHLVNLTEYHTFGSRIVNELRLGFNRYDQTVPVGPQTFGNLGVFPNITLDDLNLLNIGPDPNAPQFTIQNYYGIIDNLSWTRGAHQLKFGIEGRRYISPQQFTQRSRGDYEWSSTQAFLHDLSPDVFGERSSGLSTYYGDQKAIYFYANDTWRVNTHLSLNYGIRYEYTTIPVGEDRLSLNSIASTPSIIVAGVNQPFVFQKLNAPKNNWAPRIGIAYSPGTSGSTSIRAGFGLAYDVLYDNIGILAPPPQLGATHDVDVTQAQTPGFFSVQGGLPGGGSGLKTLTPAEAIAQTSNWIAPNIKWPYALNWNLGVQHSFRHAYTVEARYVGTRGVHLDVQSQINRKPIVNASQFLPTFLTPPSQATLDALPLTLAGLQAQSHFLPQFGAAGFVSDPITAFLPLGWSNYHGLQTSLQRRFSNGLQMNLAYTWSRTIDNSTADFHSTDLTPRRPQDAQNFAADKAVSALSRTHRLSLAAVYDLPLFKSNSSRLMRNLIGNWQFAPVYVYESPEWVTVQSHTDSNLNGDSAGDRAIFNPLGIPGTGNSVEALKNSAGATVGYLAGNVVGGTFVPCGSPTACGQYVVAGKGAFSNLGRNTLPTAPTNNIDLSIFKKLTVTERLAFTFGAQIFNLINHPQYIPGSNPAFILGVNEVGGAQSFSTIAGSYIDFVTPGKAVFNKPSQVFPSNARQMQLVVRLTF